MSAGRPPSPRRMRFAAMHLIEASPLPTPADAERLMADIWQLSAGRGLGLYTLAIGGRVMLGVHSWHSGVEEAASTAIADQCGGAVESGWMVPQMLNTASDVAAANLVPTNRHLEIESRTYGWQRSDPLRATFLSLANAPGHLLVGVAVSLRALPDLTFLVSVGTFAAGDGASTAVARLASTFGGIGVRVRRPVLQRRAVCRMLDAVARRPASVRRTELVTRFWHPPYGSSLAQHHGADGEGREPARTRPAP